MPLGSDVGYIVASGTRWYTLWYTLVHVHPVRLRTERILYLRAAQLHMLKSLHGMALRAAQEPPGPSVINICLLVSKTCMKALQPMPHFGNQLTGSVMLPIV